MGKRKSKSPQKDAEEELLIDFSTPGPQTNGTVVSGPDNSSNPFSPLSAGRSSDKQHNESGDDENAPFKEHVDEQRRKSEKQAIMNQRAARRKSMANRRVSFAPEATLHTWNVIELAEDSTTSSASNSTRRQSSTTGGQSPLLDVHSPAPESDPSEPPSTPPEQLEELLVKASPAHQRDLHQKKHRRRSSGVPPLDVNPSEENALLSSPFSESSAADIESSPAIVEESINSDESDEDGDTAMSVEEMTGQTDASTESGSSTRSSLDERLRQAAHEAGTAGIERDENVDDVSMEMVTDSVTHAFQPFAKSAEDAKLQDLTSMQDQENVNPFSPAFRKGTQVKEPQPLYQQDETQDMSMDVTTAVGGIVSQEAKKTSPKKPRRKSVAPSRRRSSFGRRRFSEGGSTADDETMEFTMAAGGILSQQNFGETADASLVDEDEEMTMELTSVVGGFVHPRPISSTSVAGTSGGMNLYASGDLSVVEDETMEMTAAIGGILPPIEERTEPNTDAENTEKTEIAQAVGEILPVELRTGVKSKAKQLMEAETDAGQLSGSPYQTRTASASETQQESPMTEQVATTIASETGSPSMTLKPRLSGRKSTGGLQLGTPKHAGPKQSTPVTHTSKHNTPIKAPGLKLATPTKQLTPQPEKPDKPDRTPILNNVAYRSASPRRLFKAEIKAKSSPASAKKSPPKRSLFSHDSETGQQTPNVVLAPKPHQHLRRGSSGIGVDKEGLGSPRVAKLLDRRSSIGESIPTLVPNPKHLGVVKFDDPKQMEDEIDAEREEEKRRESGRFIMEQEADMPAEEENATLTLKEMIESMTPKKNKLKGRKSLHVGAAKGILGKRPVELDLDLEDEAEAEVTPKRLRTLERSQSPVKKAHLPAPPSKAETTGRVTRAKRQSLEEIAGNAQTPNVSTESPSKSSAANTPKPQGRFKDAPIVPASTRPTSFEDKLDNVIGAIDAEVGQSLAEGEGPVSAEEKIHLQDFLNMTGIHFMELNATKRRHTMAPIPSTSPKHLTGELDSGKTSLAESVVAATTTVPLLELYQHATRELKSYISSGRRIIRSIEAETLEEQPPLFREYMDARPDVKMVMDNQFRNGKVNARLRSKEGWYAWRNQLEEGLRSGLEAIREDMQHDAEVLAEQERLLHETVPNLERHYEALQQEEDLLQRRVDELESEDHEALGQARKRFREVDTKLEAKRKTLDDLKGQMQEKEETLTAAAELKQEFLDQISEAERVREECRGWDPKDVQSIKQRVETIEATSGWKIVAVEEEDEEDDNAPGPALTMRYKDQLRLFFYPAAFVLPSVPEGHRKSRRSDPIVPSAPISLTYQPSPSSDDAPPTASSLPTEKRFLLQFLQSHVQAFASMPPSTISPAQLLRTISQGWELATRISEEARLLDLVSMADVSIQSDEVLALTAVLVLPEKKGRLDVRFRVRVGMGTKEHGIEAEMEVEDIKAAWGHEEVRAALEGRKGAALREAVKRTLSKTRMGEGVMAGAVRELLGLLGAQKSLASPEKGKGKGVKARTPRRK